MGDGLSLLTLWGHPALALLLLWLLLLLLLLVLLLLLLLLVLWALAPALALAAALAPAFGLVPEPRNPILGSKRRGCFQGGQFGVFNRRWKGSRTRWQGVL